MVEAIDGNKSLPNISVLDAMKMLVLSWDEVTDKTVQNCFKKAGFCEIEEDDAVSDDLFAALKDTATLLINRDKTFEDVTVEDVASSDDMLVSTQEPLSDADILVGFLSIDVHAQHQSDDEEESQSEVSEVLDKPNPPSQLRAAIDTLMNYSMIVGTVELQGLTVKASKLVELEMKSCAKQKKITNFFTINSSTIQILPVKLMKILKIVTKICFFVYY